MRVHHLTLLYGRDQAGNDSSQTQITPCSSCTTEAIQRFMLVHAKNRSKGEAGAGCIDVPCVVKGVGVSRALKP